MINNRQNGRRRGRGGGGNGPRQGGGQGRPDNGNRIDNRARGNASQLLEKYRNLASDAQRQGDRVNTEYYLQFADHYFRVLADQRGRFEEQQPRRQQNDFDAEGDDDYGDEGEPIRAGEQQMEADERQQQPRGDNGQQRRDRGTWNDRGDRQQRRGREDDRDSQRERQRDGQRDEEVAGQHRADPPSAGESLDGRAEAVLEADAPLAAPARRRGRPRRDEQPAEANGANGVDADRLPPSFGVAAANDSAPTEAKPRRRRVPSRSAEAPDAAE